ncbi:MAG: hypothetical protein BWY65_01013 [Firmicutes bacterium ADurb.Bin373]|nr:MAG: hypothetical protein BWY65_01013 [Firmicutes bacterium ADurb.Bin373]
MAASFSLAETTFGLPTSFVKCRTCLCRLEALTTSSSIRPMVPTPDAAR